MEQQRQSAHNNKIGFTLIELIVVATIIGLLAGSGAVAYTQFSKQSRDAKRKADLEQIRAAVELYKSNNSANSYPTSIGDLSSCSLGALTDGTNTYLSKVPNDPKCNTSIYYYDPIDSSGGACDGSSSDPCVNYTLAATLEKSSTVCQSLTTQCTSGTGCTYCVGPYGEK